MAQGHVHAATLAHLVCLTEGADVQGIHHIEDQVHAGIQAHCERCQGEPGRSSWVKMTAQGPVSTQTEPSLRGF